MCQLQVIQMVIACLILFREVDAYSGILRFAACKELQENEEWYCTTVKNWGYSIWALSSDLLLPDEHSEHEIFSAEINFCRQSGRDGSLLLMWGLASVLKRPIRSIYPEVRAEDIRQLLNRTLPPRVPNGKPEIVLMWTSCNPDFEDLSPQEILKNFRPNHIVPVVKIQQNLQMLASFAASAPVIFQSPAEEISPAQASSTSQTSPPTQLNSPPDQSTRKRAREPRRCGVCHQSDHIRTSCPILLRLNTMLESCQHYFILIDGEITYWGARKNRLCSFAWAILDQHGMVISATKKALINPDPIQVHKDASPNK